MNDRHQDKNDNLRDPELDRLLAPLRDANPGELAASRWDQAVQAARQKSSIRRRWIRRGLEWAVAASIGFGVATVLMQARTNDVQEETTEITTNDKYYDMDATDVRLVAKSD